MNENLHLILDFVVAGAGVGWVIVGLLIKTELATLRLEIMAVKLELTRNLLDAVGAIDTHVSNDEITHGDIKRRLDNIEMSRSHARN